jgi:hypothetical protein
MIMMIRSDHYCTMKRSIQLMSAETTCLKIHLYLALSTGFFFADGTNRQCQGVLRKRRGVWGLWPMVSIGTGVYLWQSAGAKYGWR